jgi:alpha-methylacyl-CoA racemase
MMLADMGADVIRIDRINAAGATAKWNVLNRNRQSIAVDLKKPTGVELVLKLVERADALIEGFRPGVMERLRLGPDVCFERNPKLIYGRMTGWGQEGPLAQAAGHDINYIALTGALHSIGRRNEGPVPPLNLIGDFGGGGLLLAFGVVCGILEARTSGRGQVIDAAMTDGSALLMAMMYGLKAAHRWSNDRGENLLDSGAHFYDVYECADGKWIALGSIEPQFYRLLLEKTGITDADFQSQMDASLWPGLKEKLSEVIKTKTRDEWRALMEGSDVCFAPVLDMDEAPFHPHNRERGTFIDVAGVTQPAPAPRFSRTPPETPKAPDRVGQRTREVLRLWGLSEEEIAELKNKGAIKGDE